MKSIFRSVLALGVVSLSFQASASSISSDKFIDCYIKAVNESIQDFQKYFPKDQICEAITYSEKIKVVKLYSEPSLNSGRVYYSAQDMGNSNVRFHYDRLKYELDCVEEPSNIISGFVIGLGNAVKDLSGKKTFTNRQIVEDAFTKMLGREMFSENGSDDFSEHTFEYCSANTEQEE